MTTFSPEPTRDRSGLAPMLNTLGAVIVGFWVVVQYINRPHADPVVLVVSMVALGAWVARAFVPEAWRAGARIRDLGCLVMIVAGSLVTEPTEALLITPAIVGVVALVADARHRFVVGVAVAVLGAAIVMIESVAANESSGFLLGCLGGFALGLIVGLNRRQLVRATQRERELFARTLEVENEQQRSALLADRATIARDIHDVLAHSLGGLVVQLDAVEALLEAGRVDDAASRVTAARALAGDGLSEARRAVAALRDPLGHAHTDSSLDTLTARDALRRLLELHTSLGGTLLLAGSLDVGDAFIRLDTAHRRALAGVVREALSNARRHAAGEPVTVTVDEVPPGRGAGSRILGLAVSNPLGVGLGGVGVGLGAVRDPGNGLLGMRERYRELGDDSSVSASVVGDAFIVETRTVMA